MTYTQLIKAYQETGNQRFLDRAKKIKEGGNMKKVTNRDYKKINRLNNQIMLTTIKRNTLIEQFVGEKKQFKSLHDFDRNGYEIEQKKWEENAIDRLEATYPC